MYHGFISYNMSYNVLVQVMGSKTWADQWGTTGSFGGEDECEKPMGKARLGGGSSSKMEEVKEAASKAKTVAVVGAQKVKSGTSMGIKWVKGQYKKKFSSSSK